MSDYESEDISLDYEDDQSSFSFEESDLGEPEFSDNEPADTGSDEYFHNYKQWTLQDFVQKELLNVCEDLHSTHMSSCDYDDILVMMHFCNWLKESVINRYFDDGPRLYRECGLVWDRAAKSNVLAEKADFSCPICCSDYDQVEVYSLSCRHEYCVNCYTSYVGANVAAGRLVRCIDVDCDLTIPHGDVQRLVDSGSEQPPTPLASNCLIVASCRVYIDARRLRYRWCPAPDCNSLVEVFDKVLEEPAANRSVDINKVPIVTCANAHEFCYDCKYENHLPCPCWVVKMWIKKCQDDSETANWIEANTHSCPRCSASIEKNGGCNHMTCSTCKHEFCWICFKDWDIHGSEYYRCNKYDPEIKDNIESNQKSKRLSLQRYLHYYKRFSVHETSMKGDKKTLDTVDDKMRIYMEQKSKSSAQNLSWIDVQFLHDAFRALTNGRKTLKWSYCFGFYLLASNYGEVFESMQEYLNTVVEDLSKIFEEINHKKNNSKSTELIMQHKSEIINLSVLLVKRQKSLIDSATSGLNQGLLQFETV